MSILKKLDIFLTEKYDDGNWYIVSDYTGLVLHTDNKGKGIWMHTLTPTTKTKPVIAKGNPSRLRAIAKKLGLDTDLPGNDFRGIYYSSETELKHWKYNNDGKVSQNDSWIAQYSNKYITDMNDWKE